MGNCTDFKVDFYIRNYSHIKEISGTILNITGEGKCRNL